MSSSWSRKDDGRLIVPPRYERVVDTALAIALIVCIAYLAFIYATQFVPLLRAEGVL